MLLFKYKQKRLQAKKSTMNISEAKDIAKLGVLNRLDHFEYALYEDSEYSEAEKDLIYKELKKIQSRIYKMLGYVPVWEIKG